MNASVIRCPGCGAADTSVATPAGVHTCVYCGVRYQFSAGAPHTVGPAAAAAPARRRGLGLALSGLVLVGVAVGAAVSFGDGSRRSGGGAASGGPPAGRAAENRALSVAAPAEQTAPATGEFTLESTRPAGDQGLWIYGYFHNTSPFTLGKTKITAVFYDKDGQEIGQDSGYTEDDVIAADARAHTVLLVSDAPSAYDRIAFEVRAERPSYLPAQVEGLELEVDAPRRDGFLGWKYAGKVHNRSGKPARFVKVQVLGFDQSDKFAGHAYTYASADALEDGATARFDGSLLGSSADFKRFEFRVSGQPTR